MHKKIFLASLFFLIPGCIFQSSGSKKIQRIERSLDMLFDKYENEIRLFKRWPEDSAILQEEFRKIVLIKNDTVNGQKPLLWTRTEDIYANYSYIQYKNVLDKDINKAKELLAKVDKYEDLHIEISELIGVLTNIKNTVLCSKEYSDERKEFERNHSKQFSKVNYNYTQHDIKVENKQ